MIDDETQTPDEGAARSDDRVTTPPDRPTRDDGPASPDDGPAGGRRSRLLAAILAGLLLAGGGVVGAQLLDARAAATDREERVRVATDAALALLSYDHADLDGSLAALDAVATQGFAADVRERFATELAAPIAEVEAVATAEVTEVFLAVDEDAAADRTRALVSAEVAVATNDGTRRSAPTLELALVRSDDGWRVEDAGGTGRGGLPAPD